MDEYIIVVDTREQKPLWTTTNKNVEIGTLHVGDYSIKGHETQFAIERKSAMDLVGTLTSGHKRFKKEIAKALTYKYFAIVVEASYTDIVQKTYDGAHYSKMKGFVITSILFTLHMKYGINFFLCKDRKESKSIIREICKCYIKNNTFINKQNINNINNESDDSSNIGVGENIVATKTAQ